MGHTVCPWWLGYFLLNPLRRLMQDPEKLLAGYITAGMSVLDVGCGMGYFTLPMAVMVGDGGRVLAVDLQEKMVGALMRRAVKAGIAGRIIARTCSADTLGIDDHHGRIDFALAFAVVHEVPDQNRLLSEICCALKPGGRLLLAEPSFHVPRQEFAATLALAAEAGFAIVGRPSVKSSLAALLAKQS